MRWQRWAALTFGPAAVAFGAVVAGDLWWVTVLVAVAGVAAGLVWVTRDPSVLEVSDPPKVRPGFIAVQAVLIALAVIVTLPDVVNGSSFAFSGGLIVGLSLPLFRARTAAAGE